MSDRVAIIGGSVSRRDHFPFPVADFESGPDELSWPMTVELETACRWFYRVKRWQFLIQFSYSTNRGSREVGHEGEYIGGTGSIQFDFIPKVRTSPAAFDVTDWEREAQTVLMRSGAGFNFTLGFDGAADAGFAGGDEIPFAVSNISGYATYDDESGDPLIFGQLYFDCSNLLYELGLFHPWFALHMDTIDADGMYMATDNSATGDVPFTFVVVGSEQTVDLLRESDLGGVATQISTADITVDAIEYWPYATTSGEPVYDTSTGEQLRSPFS